ncbi:MAG: hypothetical protein ABIP74_05345 [Candidatus Saccharimonas sp.]
MVKTTSTLELSPRIKFVLGVVPTSTTPLNAEEQLAVLNAAVVEIKRYIKYVDLYLSKEQRRELEDHDSMINDRNTTLIADHSSQLGHRFYLSRDLAIHDAVLKDQGDGPRRDHRTPVVQVVRHDPPYERLGELLVQDRYLLSALLYGISEILDDKISALRDHISRLGSARDRVKMMYDKTTHLNGQVPRATL